MVVFDVKNSDKICGIYCIKNTITNKCYIGKSFSVRTRIMKHFSNLRNNNHANKHLQNSYNKHGKENFQTYILEECDMGITPEVLKGIEQSWINDYGKAILYNKILDVMNHDGNSFLGKNHSDLTRLKISTSKKGKQLGSSNPNFGNKQSLETRIKMAVNNPKSKLTIVQVLEIKQLLQEGKLTDKEISVKFNISRNVITRIANGDRWANITGGPISTQERRGKRNIGQKYSTERKNNISKALKDKNKINKGVM